MKKLLPFLFSMLAATRVVAGITMVHPAKLPTSTTLPATCTTGDIYHDSNATSGQQIYVCESANTWVLQGDGGGSGSGDIESVTAGNGLDGGGTTGAVTLDVDFSSVASKGDAILNTSSVESKTLHVTSATVRNDFYFTDSDSAQRLSLSHSALPRSGGFGPQTVSTTLNVDTFEASTVSGGFSIIVSTELPSSSGFNRTLDGHAAIDLSPPSAGSASSIGLNVRETGLSGASSSFTVQQSTISFAVGGTYSATWDSNGFRSYSGDILSDNHIVAYDVIGSTTGNFAFQGSTITFDAPPIDTLNRIAVLNNGSVSWPEMADGASLSSTQTFTGSNTFQSSSTFTGSVYVGTAVNKITTTVGLLDSAYFTKVSPSTGIAAGTLASDVMASSVSAASIKAALTAGSNVTLTTTTYGYSIAASGGGSGPFDQAESSTTLSMGGFNLTNVGSLEFTNGAGDDWTLNGSTTAMLYNDFTADSGSITVVSVPLAANSTYSVTGMFMVDPQGTIGGCKFALDVPDDYASLRLYLSGISATAAGYRTDEGVDTDATPNGNAFATYNAGEGQVHATGFIKTGASGGTANFQVVIIGPQTLRAGTQFTVVKQP